MSSGKNSLMSAHSLTKYFPIKKGFFQKVIGNIKAVDGISFDLNQGETLGLVGESGCGKSTLGRTLIRLYEPTSGKIEFNGTNFLDLSGAELRNIRKDIQMIFQDPIASLDPKMTVGQILRQPFEIHNIGTNKEREKRIKELMDLVGLAQSHINRYPHEFSGGQRQRICIARSISLNPKLIICDEPVSALDVSIQAQILNLLKDLQKKLGLTYIFISHDLSVIEHFCDRVAVMYLGKIVEISSRNDLFKNPKHPYTQALLASIPKFAEGKKQIKKSISGEVPSPLDPPKGCSFHPRCPSVKPECMITPPELLGDASNKVACHLFKRDQ